MKRILYIFIIALISLSANAQSLNIKSFVYQQADLSARTNRVNDVNDDACALVKVRLAIPGATFKGMTTGTPEYKNGEYWVYMSENSKRLSITVRDFLPLDISFADYGIKSLEGLNTYILTIEAPQLPNTSSTMVKVKFNIAPTEALLKVDNLEWEVKDGSAEIPLSVGSHTYTVSAPYYVTKNEVVIIDGTAEHKLIETKLTSAFSELNITTNPAGATIKEGKTVYGTTPLSGRPIIAGKHQLEISLNGYQTETIDLDIKDETPVTILKDLSSLVNVLVKTSPNIAALDINGNNVGLTPKEISYPAGTYDFALRAKGYYDYNKKVEITGARELYIKMRRRYFNKYGGYIEAFGQIGSMMGVGGDFGLYLHNANVEFSYAAGLQKSEVIYWNSTDSENLLRPTGMVYKPKQLAFKAGYGVTVFNRLLFTPQVGFAVTNLQGNIDTEGECQGVEKTYCASATVGARLNFALIPHLGLSLTPEYALPLNKGKAFDAMAAASSKINSLNGGFNCKVGFNVFF